ncbi:MAG: phosphoglycerate dehydrogenase [Anaerolineae bacterium]|nr:phosphoglycerate dehydrogenase [Anaerolineae bacterium]
MPFAVTSTVGYLTPEARRYLEDNGCAVTERDFGPLTEDELCRAVHGIEGIVAAGDWYTAKVFQAADRLKIVARTGAGYDTIDLQAATRCGVWITNTPGANSDAVADLTVALMLCLLRNIPTMVQDMKAGRWNQLAGRELGNVTIGITGTGYIGRAVIKRVAGFGSQILAYDVQPDSEFARQLSVQYVPLDDLMTQADIVSLHVSLSDSTRHMIDERRLKLMKPSAYLVNTSRPGIVDKAALIRALEARTIAGAAIDVHDPAPTTADDPLVRLDNVIATPWVGYKTQDAIDRMCIAAAQDVVTVLRGGRPRFPVNQL